MIIREALKSLTKTKVFTIIIIFQLIIVSFVSNLVIEKISSMNTDMDVFNKNSMKNYFWIVENLFDNELEHRFWNSENSLKRIKNYYKDMADSDDYKYLEICSQEITIKDKDSGMEEFKPQKNISVNLDCLTEFGIKAAKGRLFNESEMSIDLSAQTIPILLGYNLRDKYKIGDVIEGTYLLKNMNFKVIGVLEKNSRLIKTNVIETGGDPSFYYLHLDNVYVTPLVNCEEEPKTDEDRLFERILYMFKLNATIATRFNDYAGEIKDKIDTLASKYDMYEFEIIQISNTKLNILKLASKDNLEIIEILSVFLLIFLMISIWAVVSVKISKSMRDYAIHLLAGASKKKIVLYMITEMVIILFASHASSFVITKKLLSNQANYTMIWIVISVVACLGACIYPIFRLTQKNVDILLEGDTYE